MRLLVLLVAYLLSTACFASFEVREFSDPDRAARYDTLIDELRCLVCQNQNLADSNAELAQDLRKQVYEMLEAGKSDKEIIDFMVQRYGDFVLYRPPLKNTTILLWAGPFVLLILAVFVLLRFIRTRARQMPVELNDAQRQRVRELLNKEGHGQ